MSVEFRELVRILSDQQGVNANAVENCRIQMAIWYVALIYGYIRQTATARKEERWVGAEVVKHVTRQYWLLHEF